MIGTLRSEFEVKELIEKIDEHIEDFGEKDFFGNDSKDIVDEFKLWKAELQASLNGIEPKNINVIRWFERKRAGIDDIL